MASNALRFWRWSMQLSLCFVAELAILGAADTRYVPSKKTDRSYLQDANVKNANEARETNRFLGANLTPEELTRIEITDIPRDRFQSNPRIKVELKNLKKDLISAKFGKPLSVEPIWMKYGPNAFPLLDYYTQSPDPTIQRHGLNGLRMLGKPYTTLWLRKQIQRRSMIKFDWNQDYDWQNEFDLRDPQTRQEIIGLARKHLETTSSVDATFDNPYYYDRPIAFNTRLLEDLLGPTQSEMVTPAEKQAHREHEQQQKEQTDLVQQWEHWETLQQLNDPQTQQLLDDYRYLSEDGQFMLLTKLLEIKTPQRSVAANTLLQQVMHDKTSPHQVFTLAEFDRNGTVESAVNLQAFLNGDLHKTYSIVATSLNLRILNILQKYPESRFVRGCREYGDLTGHSYYGNGLRSKQILRQIKQKTPAQKVADWRDWLNRYGDHPGADDATHQLAVALLEADEVVPATRQWIQLITQEIGDGDARVRGYRRLRVMLDVGLSTQQIRELLNLPESQPIAPLLRYALAVHLAREQDYAQAIQVSQGINLTKIPRELLSEDPFPVARDESGDRGLQILKAKQEMQAMFQTQRQRWQTMLTLQQTNTPKADYQIAANWSSPSGWKNGYLALWALPLWKGSRWKNLPTSSYYYEDYCREWWVCDLSQRSEVTVRESYQKGNPNAVALTLYENLLNQPQTPAVIREKTLYMEAMTLANEVLEFQPSEAQRIHPPAGVIASPRKKVPEYPGSDRFSLKFDVLGDYQHRIDRIIAQMQQHYSKSSYIDDLLLANYHLTGKKDYLEQVIKQYPQGDRIEEAQFLLSHAPS